MVIKIEIPYEPVSVNGLYAVSGGRKVKTYKGRLYADRIYHIVRGLKIDKDELISLRIELYGPWYNKNGTLKKKDLMNYEKATVDAIFANIKADDCQIIEFSMVKVHGPKFESIVYIEPLKANHDFITNKPQSLNTKKASK